MLKKSRWILPYALTALPVLALAQFGNLEQSFETIIDLINSIIIPLIVGIAGVYFMIGVIKYVTSGDSEEGRKGARNMMIWGIIALFVMISVWGLVNILIDTFNFSENTIRPSDLPEIPTR
ncbi:MAG: hypothetical protein KBC48_02665 [Candidatus Pacebacteria bacterium]|nr:hypothetical protein [Candidatus Paceibacterota bacterium]